MYHVLGREIRPKEGGLGRQKASVRRGPSAETCRKGEGGVKPTGRMLKVEGTAGAEAWGWDHTGHLM